MDLLTLGTLYQDGALRLRVQAACFIHGVELTEDVVRSVLTDESVVGSMSGTPSADSAQIPDAAISEAVNAITK